MRRGFLLLLPVLLTAETTPQLLECNKIFQERKQELELKLEEIDEARQAYEALKAATEETFRKKEAKLRQIEADLNATRKKLDEERQAIEALVEKNKKILEAIKKAKADKVAQTYAKMKPSAAAEILAAMPATDAAKLLQQLKPKTVGQILAKMDPQKASRITLLLEGEDENRTKRP